MHVKYPINGTRILDLNSNWGIKPRLIICWKWQEERSASKSNAWISRSLCKRVCRHYKGENVWQTYVTDILLEFWASNIFQAAR